MNSKYDGLKQRQPRTPRAIAGELLSLGLDKPPVGSALTFEKLLRLEAWTSETADDVMDSVRRYNMAHASERIRNFLVALKKTADAGPLDAADRTAIGDGLEVNAAIVSSSRDDQRKHLADIHPKPGSDVAEFHHILFEAFRDPSRKDSHEKAEFEEHFSAIASEGYYAEKQIEKSLSEKARPLIVELANSLSIPLKGVQRG